MKIGTVTFHQALNYGAILQTYALQRFIKANFNTETDVVDYRCPHLSHLYSYKSKITANPIKSALRIANFAFKKQRFSSFISKYINLSKTVYTYEDIQNSANEYDAFIVGSDQVWNPLLTNGDMNYLLKFAPANKRYSYAASVGLKEIPREHAEKYSDLLNEFRAISTREKSEQLLESIGVTVKPQTNIDPTLLLTGDDWKEICKTIKPQKEKFVLVYTVGHSKETMDKAVQFAAENNLKVIYVGPHIKRPGIKYIPCPRVEYLISLFRDAEYTFVNSFHGTVFSILFQRKFFSYLQFKDGRNARITNLLEICGLSHRTDIKNIKEEIDWQNVETNLNLQRKNSLNFIGEIIKNEN